MRSLGRVSHGQLATARQPTGKRCFPFRGALPAAVVEHHSDDAPVGALLSENNRYPRAAGGRFPCPWNIPWGVVACATLRLSGTFCGGLAALPTDTHSLPVGARRPMARYALIASPRTSKDNYVGELSQLAPELPRTVSRSRLFTLRPSRIRSAALTQTCADRPVP